MENNENKENQTFQPEETGGTTGGVTPVSKSKNALPYIIGALVLIVVAILIFL